MRISLASLSLYTKTHFIRLPLASASPPPPYAATIHLSVVVFGREICFVGVLMKEFIHEGAQLGRKVYWIRNKELIKVLEVDFVGMIHIHRVSKAMIRLLADIETNKHSQTYLDLVGTVKQVLRVLGFKRAHIVRMEMKSGAWIRPMESFDAGNDFKEPTCAELIGGKDSGEKEGSWFWANWQIKASDMFKNIVDMKQHHVEESVSDEVSELK
ncbi:hypothetical protein Tco_0826680 [Tanacetum coccineum]